MNENNKNHIYRTDEVDKQQSNAYKLSCKTMNFQYNIQIIQREAYYLAELLLQFYHIISNHIYIYKKDVEQLKKHK